MSVQAQWNLNQSTGSFFNIARGVLQAATSDDVQPLALLACEQFGSTLAMSQETCRKIEKVVLPTPKPAAIQFLRAVVGFSSGDSASQLGKSLAGIQFLGLATALISTMHSWKAAEAVEEMLLHTAADKTLLPTTTQIRDLLDRLEPRCLAAGFADSVAGWHIMLCHHPEFRAKPRPRRLDDVYAPAPTSIRKVVEAFSRLNRIGEEDLIGVTIRSAKDSAWLIAFTKWSLGVPPSVCYEDGTALIQEPDSPVTFIIHSNFDYQRCPFQLDFHHRVGSLEETILSREPAMQWTNMVAPSTYGKLLLFSHETDWDGAVSVLTEAIPYALSIVLANISFGELDRTSRPLERGVPNLRLSPFPSHQHITLAMSLLLNCEDPEVLPPFIEGRPVSDLPIVKEYLESLRQQCDCCDCVRLGFEQTMRPHASCMRRLFTQSLHDLVTNILGLCLFHSPESLLMNCCFYRRPVFHVVVVKILESGKPKRCHIDDLIQYTLAIVGHDYPHGWVMSSAKGQVVYPAIFNTNAIERTGYLVMAWSRGVLCYKGQTYRNALSPDRIFVDKDLFESFNVPDVDRPVNLMPGFKSMWQVTPRDGFLEVNLILMAPSHEESKANVHILWKSLAQAFMIEECAHHSEAPLDTFDICCRYTSATLPNARDVGGDEPDGPIGLVAVDGSDDLRLFTLTFPLRASFVIRKRACISCCLRICRKVNSPVLVL